MTTSFEIFARLGHFQGDAAQAVAAMVAAMAVLAYWILKT